jgi:hypothetical protein
MRELVKDAGMTLDDEDLFRASVDHLMRVPGDPRFLAKLYHAPDVIFPKYAAAMA